MAITMLVRVNGESTDTTVENDSATWLCKVGSVRTSEGGGSFIRETNHATCTFTVNIPINLAPLVRTITIGMQGAHSSPASWWHNNGDGTAYRVIFHGVVVANSAKNIGTKGVQFTALSEMQGLYERRAHLSALTNTGPRRLATDLETAHSMTINNAATMLPSGGDFYNLDRPKQKQASNGDMLRTVMGGTGMNICAEWEGTMASPVLAWRTDYPWFTGGNFRIVSAGRPWEFEYPNVGTNFRDFVAKVEVNGEQGNTLDHVGWVRYPNLRNRGPRPSTRIVDVSNGTQYYGNCVLGSASEQRKLAYQEASIRSWIDTAAECEDAAKYILRRMGEPSYLRMNTIGYWPDRLRDLADADPLFDPDPEDYAMDLASVVLGDQLRSRATGEAFDNSNGIGGDNSFGTWPSTCPVNGDEYDDLYALWNVQLTNDGDVSDVTNYYTVRSLDREWTPSGGWHIMPGLEPDNTTVVDAGDLDHGTY